MKLTYRRQTVRPRFRFATAHGYLDEQEIIVVQLEHDGIVGLGEVLPSALYGQSIESSEAALAHSSASRPVGSRPPLI